ncbi:YopX family protein [Enterococcus durans]|uniref:YopX family protein n=1 Tax=Enterococcus durans TaxID=53345 RepID=UPI003BEF153B
MIPRFRAWDKKTETIQEIESISFKEKKLVIDQKSVTWFNSDYIRNFDEVELMQSTGMKDKNGVEIFEGDVVITSKGAIGYVAYLQQEAGFVVVLKKSDYRLGHRNTGESYDVATAHEVIGNIYENSELLEEQR